MDIINGERLSKLPRTTVPQKVPPTASKGLTVSNASGRATSSSGGTWHVLAGSGWVLVGQDAENGRLPVVRLAKGFLDLESLLGPALSVHLLVKVRDDRVLLAGDKLEGAGLLIGLLGVVLGGLLLASVQVLQSLSPGGLIAPLGLVQTVADLDQLVIQVADGLADGTVDGGLDSTLDDTGGSGLDELVEQVVVRVGDRELQSTNVGLDGLGPDNRVTLVVDSLQSDVNTDTCAADDHGSQTRVLDLWESLLLAERKHAVADIGVNLGEADGDLVVRLVWDGVVWRELE